MTTNGTCPSASGTQVFQVRTPAGINRSKGWHIFEALFAENMVTLSIDGKGVFAGMAKGARQSAEDHLWIVAQTGAPVSLVS